MLYGLRIENENRAIEEGLTSLRPSRRALLALGLTAALLARLSMGSNENLRGN
jgi:hypothetical protein